MARIFSSPTGSSNRIHDVREGRSQQVLVLLSAVVLHCCFGTLRAQGLSDAIELSMRKNFPATQKSIALTMKIDSAMTAHVFARSGQIARNRVIIRESLDSAGKAFGYAMADDRTIENKRVVVLTILRKDGTIAAVQIIPPPVNSKYFDPFLRQFQNKTSAARLTLGADLKRGMLPLRSAETVLRGVNRNLILFDELRLEGRL